MKERLEGNPSSYIDMFIITIYKKGFFMEYLHIFFKELWYNQPNIVISGGLAILVLLGIYIWLLNKYQ